MRLERLGLDAFGPFTGETLDLSGGAPGGLHVIYGENEAGKSTALRGVTGLLYGIPERTEDAHLHPTSELRVSALVSGPAGERLEIVRLKKRKDSLRGVDEAAIDENELLRLLGGVDQATFAGLFGLDHQLLKKGGEALLAGAGDVGESLFEAGVGGRGVHVVLSELVEEAERLFKPRARTSRINAAVSAYRDTAKKTREAALLPEKWQEQAAELERFRREREALTEKLHRLRAEQHRVKRVLGVLGRAARMRERRDERAALGAIAALPGDAAERRERAQRAIWQAARDVERLELEIREREARHAALRVSEALLALGDETSRRLHDQLAVQARAMIDLPRREAEIRFSEDEARAILRRIRQDLDLDQVESLRLGDPEQIRIRRLATEHALLMERLATAQRDHGRVTLELEQRRGALSRLPVSSGAGELERALLAARRAGDLEARVQQARETVGDLESQIEGRRAGLGAFRGALEDLAGHPLPLAETIEDFTTRRLALEQDRAALEQERRGSFARLDEAERRIASIERQGQVPSEAALSAARARRDTGFRLVRRAWQEGADVALEAHAFDPARPLAEAVERSMLDADEISDRLRREAGQVAELAAASATRAQQWAALERVERELETSAERLAALEAEWRALWQALPIEVRPPAEMRALCRRLDELSSLVLQRAAAQRKAERLLNEQRKLVERLAGALSASGVTVPAQAALGDLLEHAENRRHALVEREREQAALTESVAELELRCAAAARELAERDAAALGWQSAWQAAVRPLKLAEEPAPDEALAVLEQLAQLFMRLDQLTQLRRRAEGIRRNQTAFAAEVASLSEAHAPQLSALGTEQAAEALVQSFNRAKEESAERARLHSEIAERRALLEGAHQNLSRAEDEIGELMRRAGVTDAAELARAEQRARRAAELDREIRELEDELLEAGEGMSLQELLDEVSAADRARLAPRLEEIEREVEENDEALQRAIGEATSRELGLDRYKVDEESTTLAQDGALYAAEIRAHVERYLRLRLGAAVLEREIERYRERNQGPLLTRAAELFPRLTLGAFRTLRVGREEPVLLCVRSDGGEVEVGGLSEGTQYQLYLALRLATLERYLEANTPLPLVLDDLLLHFDDPRAQAALEVLGELAGRVQILFFTHLLRDLELARRAVPAGRLFEHRLRSSVPARKKSGVSAASRGAE